MRPRVWKSPRPTRGCPSLFLFAGTQGRLPACALLAWRRGNHLDLLFLGFLGFPIASLLTLGHVDLPGFVGDVGTGHPQSPMPWETRGCSILGLRAKTSLDTVTQRASAAPHHHPSLATIGPQGDGCLGRFWRGP